jgi:hypothetical protein
LPWLLEALHGNRKVEEIHLHSNLIGEAGAEILHNFLISYGHIKVLDLFNNKISEKGIYKIAEAIADNKYIQKINLLKNDPVGEKTAAFILDCTKINTFIKLFEVNYSSKVKRELINKIYQELKQRKKIVLY